MVQVKPAIDIELVRKQFPALASGFGFLENAGGAQVPRAVADAMRDYMLESYVQLGAGYDASDRATETVAEAHRYINTFMNGDGIGNVVLGPSMTQLTTMIAECYARAPGPRNEIIVAETGHEANIGPWIKLAERGFKIRTWKVDPESLQCPLSDLERLLGNKTRLVAFPHVSNMLGEIVDVPAITEIAHKAGARVFVDGVAYASHRAIDVKAWDVDWYVYSTYKVYGPHMGALFGKATAFGELVGPNHYFIPNDDPYKFEIGGVNHEGCAGLLALKPYLQLLAGSDAAFGRHTVEAAFETMTELELPPQKVLVDFLLDHPAFTIIGPKHSEPSRVPTISFVHRSFTPEEITDRVHGNRMGMRWGQMYCPRMCERLGIDINTGVARVSLVHYNTVDEVHRLTAVLDSL